MAGALKYKGYSYLLVTQDCLDASICEYMDFTQGSAILDAVFICPFWAFEICARCTTVHFTANNVLQGGDEHMHNMVYFALAEILRMHVSMHSVSLVVRFFW